MVYSDKIEDCTVYYWQAYASSEGVDGPVSETFSFFTDYDGQCLRAMEVKGIKNANCRSNPWINGNEVSILRKDDTATLLGLSENNWWGKLLLQNGYECWVHLSTFEFQPPGKLIPIKWIQILKHDPKPEPKEAGEPKAEPVTACIAPNIAGVLVCQSPCPNPAYVGRVCEP
jgi:hypothetical protein